MSFSIKGIKFNPFSSKHWLFAGLLLFGQRLLSFLFVVFLAFTIIFPRQTGAGTGISSALSFQGRLTDSSGNPLGGSGTNYCMRFALYDDAAVGAPDNKLWPTGTPSTMTVGVANGVFNVGIGDTGAGGDDLSAFAFYNNNPLFLNIEVNTTTSTCSGTWENLGPRQRLDATAFARASFDLYGGQVRVGTGAGAASPKLLYLDVKNVAENINTDTCSTNGTVWYNSSNTRALMCENGFVVALSNSPTSTLAGIKQAGAGSTITSGTANFSGQSGVSVSQNAQTINIINQLAFGASNVGNTVGNTGTQTGTLVFSGGNNITLSQVTGTNGIHTLGISAAGGGAGNNTFGMSNLGNTAGTSGVISGSAAQLVFAGGPNITLSQSINGSSATISISGAAGGGGGAPSVNVYLNDPGAGVFSANYAMSNATLFLSPVNGGKLFPGNMTANTMLIGLSGSITATASSSSNTQTISIGFYSNNAGTLSLAFSASTTIAPGAATSNSALSHGPRFLTLHSSQFNVAPTFSQGNYWIGIWQRSSNFAMQASWMGHRFFTSNQRSGTFGVSSATATSKQLFPYWGHYSASFSTAMPQSIAQSVVVGASAWAGFTPYVMFNNMTSNF